MFVLAGQGAAGLTEVFCSVSGCEWGCAWLHQCLPRIHFALLCSTAVLMHARVIEGRNRSILRTEL